MRANFFLGLVGLASSFVVIDPDSPRESGTPGPAGLAAPTVPLRAAGRGEDVTQITPAGRPLSTALFLWLSPGSTGLDGARLFDSQPLLPDPGTPSSVSRVLGLLKTDLVRPGKRATDGRLHLTSYGAPTDRNLDRYTAQGMGNRGNRLRPTSIALSADLAKRLGLDGGEAVYLRTRAGTVFLGHFDDSTARRLKQTVDFYDPQGRLGGDFLVSLPAGRWELVAERVPEEPSSVPAASLHGGATPAPLPAD